MLIFIKKSHSDSKHAYNWYSCSFCNQEVVRRQRNKMFRSCGCQMRQRGHGHDSGGKPTPELKTYRKMLDRCSNTNNKDFKNYGGRGIRVCDRWKESFIYFLIDMGYRPSSKHSIDRINNDGPYSSGNCRWATKQQQSRNTRTNVNVEFNGETKILSDWLKELRIPRTSFYRKIQRGQTIADIFTEYLK